MKKPKDENDKPLNKHCNARGFNVAILICCVVSIACSAFNMAYTINTNGAIEKKIKTTINDTVENEPIEEQSADQGDVSNDIATESGVSISVSNAKMLLTVERQGVICNIQKNSDNKYTETALALTAKVKNNSDSEVIISKALKTFQIFDGDSSLADRCDYTGSKDYSNDWFNSGGILKPGGEVEYKLLFAVPTDLNDNSLYLVLNAKNNSVLSKTKFSIDMYKANNIVDAY